MWRDSAPFVEIVDDGHGMERDRLIEAMRLGTNSRSARESGDLGRFGLGLKTASLSQASVLSVISKHARAEVAAVRWDIDEIEASGDWRLVEGSPEEMGLSADKLGSKNSGTIVRWDRLDRLLGPDGDADNFFAIAEGVGRHLSMTFHRMLAVGRVNIILNDVPLSPWDPVAEDIAKMLGEAAVGRSGRIVCRSYVMSTPHVLSGERARFAAGPQDWIQQQGFYVYREGRLIVGGGWLGLGPADRPWRLDPKYNLARLTVDIANADDEEWQVDVRKAFAEPPESCRSELLKIAKVARRRALASLRPAVNKPRGPDAPQVGREVPIWMPGAGSATAPFRVNRRHPFVVRVRAAMTDTTSLRTLLDFIERSAPLSPISAAIDGAAAAARARDEADIRRLLVTLYPNFRRVLNLTPEDACAKLLEKAHFREHREFVVATVRTLELEMTGSL